MKYKVPKLKIRKVVEMKTTTRIKDSGKKYSRKKVKKIWSSKYESDDIDIFW